MNQSTNHEFIEQPLSLNGAWEFKSSQDDAWLPAQVPGTNFTDLLANNKIDDPFYRDNEDHLQWIEKLDWHYRRSFQVSADLLAKQAVYLDLQGLDTIAQVFVNGQLVIATHNMFIANRVAVKDVLNVGENSIEIIFKSPIEEHKDKPEALGVIYPAENDKTDLKLSVFCRKAPYSFGWDWGPKFVTSGIWQDVALVGVDYAHIEDVHFKQDHSVAGQVTLDIAIELTAEQAFSGCVKVTNAQLLELNQVIDLNVKTGANQVATQVVISDPQLWWPNGLGEAFLYDFDVIVCNKNQPIAATSKQIGLRTVEVVNEPDEHGESFFVKVNGHPVFMKGANYIPSDSFLTEVSSEKYQQIFADTVAANMNMLRIWGGGIYEKDEFYQLADQHGILIWQDFMFACTLYPGDAEFIENVEQEANYQVKRLRNHACIALWCGNNEVSMGIEKWEWAEKFGYSEEKYAELIDDYNHLFSEVLPRVVDALDDKFYFASSPIGFWENLEDDNRGDNHYWGVWHGEEPFSEFKKRVPRFMSEFGFQSFPLLDSMKRYATAEDRDLSSRVMRVHQKHPRGNQLIKSYMEGEYHEAKDFESFLYLSQVQQAMGMKAGFEAHRIGMPFCMGTLYWQFNDCWPVASWSGIDYYGKWKALHYQAKRSFEPVGLFVENNESSFNVVVVSDLLVDKSYTYNVQLLDFNGNAVWAAKQVICAQASTSQVIDTLSREQLVAELDKLALTQGQAVLKVTLQEVDNVDAEPLQEYFYLTPTKDLALNKPQLQLETHIGDDKLGVKLSTDTLVKSLHLQIDDDFSNFSDNFFDLLPGEEKWVFLTWGNESEVEKQQKAAAIKTMSIVDTF